MLYTAVASLLCKLPSDGLSLEASNTLEMGRFWWCNFCVKCCVGPGAPFEPNLVLISSKLNELSHEVLSHEVIWPCHGCHSNQWHHENETLEVRTKLWMSSLNFGSHSTWRRPTFCLWARDSVVWISAQWSHGSRLGCRFAAPRSCVQVRIFPRGWLRVHRSIVAKTRVVHASGAAVDSDRGRTYF